MIMTEFNSPEERHRFERAVALLHAGVLPSNIQLTLADLWDVQQLEYLCRVHTLLAQMYAFGTLCKQHSFSAYSCVLRIWQVGGGQGVGGGVNERAAGRGQTVPVSPSGNLDTSSRL